MAEKEFSDLSDLFNGSFSSEIGSSPAHHTPQSTRSGHASGDERTPSTNSPGTPTPVSSPLTPYTPNRRRLFQAESPGMPNSVIVISDTEDSQLDVLLAELAALEQQRNIIDNQIESINALIEQARQ